MVKNNEKLSFKKNKFLLTSFDFGNIFVLKIGIEGRKKTVLE